jgi:hypothetical protein
MIAELLPCWYTETHSKGHKTMTLALIQNGTGPNPLNNVNFVAHVAVTLGSTLAGHLVTSGIFRENNVKIAMAACSLFLTTIVLTVNDDGTSSKNDPKFVKSIKSASAILGLTTSWLFLSLIK